jgi:dipeptidyl aminopeptidase/acylaminoacyl peptidase
MERTSRTLRALVVISGWLGYAAAAHSTGSSVPLEAYGHLPQVELVRVSPSGERVALIGVANDKRQLVLANAADHKLLKAAGVGSNKIRDLEWAGDNHVLVFVTSTTPRQVGYVGRYELGAVLHVGFDDAAPWAVFDNSDSIEHVVYGYFGASVKDGQEAAYFSGVTLQRQRGFGPQGYLHESGNPDLYRVDLRTAKPTLIASGAGAGHDWLMGRDGSVVAHVEYNGDSGESVVYLGADRAKVLQKEVDPLDALEIEGRGRSAATVLVVKHTDDEEMLEEIDSSTGHIERLFPELHVIQFFFDPVSGLLLGVSTMEEPGARLFDAALQKHYDSTRRAFPGRTVHLHSFSPNLKEMIVFTEGTGDSGTYWLVSSVTHRADPVGYAYPQIRDDSVGPTSMVAYHAADGLAMEGVLTLPPGREPKSLPLVVFPHGGPMGIHDDLRFDWWAQAVASRGYAVFQPNYRGSGGYSVEFQKAGYGEWGRKMLSDIRDGVKELANQDIIDPKRVCIMGGSYGGYAALAGVTVQQGVYRCAVSVAGVASMSTFLDYERKMHGESGPTMRYWHKVTGSESGSVQALYDISPSKYAARADAPILLIHGKDDTRVPIEQSLKMAAALKSAKKTYEYVELENEDHFLSRDVTRLAMLKATVAFLEKYNPAQ